MFGSNTETRRGTGPGGPFCLIVVVLCQGFFCPSRATEEGQRSEELLVRADGLVASGSVDEAVRLLLAMREKNPSSPLVNARLGKIYYEKADFLRAIAYLRPVAALETPNPEAVQLLALAYVATGQGKLAIPLLERLLAQGGPAEFDSSYLLGVCYLKAHEYDKARGAFARMYSVSADSAPAHLLFARMLVREHMEHEAIAELNRAIEGNPRLPMVHFLLGEIYLHQLDAKLALAEFDKEMEISPTVWLVYWRQGDALFRLADYEQAERALKRAIWLNESFSAPYVLVGQIELKKGDVKLAIGFLDRAARMDPNNRYAHYFLGQAYQQSGLPDKAKEQFDAVRGLLAEKSNELLPGVANNANDLPGSRDQR